MTINDGTDPIAGATVTIGESTETTNASGEVEFELAYGDYEATISATGYTSKTETLAFRSNHKSFTVVLESASQTGTVTVTAIDSEELAVENATVLLSTETITLDSEPSTDIIVGGGVTGADGTITLKTFDEHQQWTDVDADIPFGTYYLSGFADTGENIIASLNETFVVDGDEIVTITLTETTTPTGTVTITVLKNSDDSPLEGAEVGIYEDGQSLAPIVEGHTNSSGVCTLTEVPYDDYYLDVTCEGYTQYSEAFTVDGDETATIKLTTEG